MWLSSSSRSFVLVDWQITSGLYKGMGFYFHTHTHTFVVLTYLKKKMKPMFIFKPWMELNYFLIVGGSAPPPVPHRVN